jgi:hypothetical protein
MTSSTISFVMLAGYPLASALSSKRTFPVAASMTIAPEYGLLEMISNAIAGATTHRSNRRMSVKMSNSFVFVNIFFIRYSRSPDA